MHNLTLLVQDCILLKTVKPEGKSEMLARDWANGAKILIKGK